MLCLVPKLYETFVPYVCLAPFKPMGRGQGDHSSEALFILVI